MSYFSGENQNTEQQGQSNQEDFVQKVVAEKGEQWKDPQALAKGYLSAQEYISTLETQTKEMRDEINKQDYAKELLTKFENQGSQPTMAGTQENKGGGEQENTTPAFSEEQLKSLVSGAISEHQANSVKQANIQTVDAKLTEMYGTEAAKTVDKKAGELGLSKDQLTKIAEDSPDAFFRLMGEAPRKEANPVSQGSINSTAETFNHQNGERDWNFYQELRRTDRRKYFSPAMQKQMMNDKIRLGDKFGN